MHSKWLDAIQYVFGWIFDCSLKLNAKQLLNEFETNGRCFVSMPTAIMSNQMHLCTRILCELKMWKMFVYQKKKKKIRLNWKIRKSIVIFLTKNVFFNTFHFTFSLFSLLQQKF